jgi:phosphoribosylformylglycinamidine synthase subunit PurQ / glutaminase
MSLKTLILRTAGTNCDRETAHAFELAGATCDFVHINRVLENKSILDNYAIAAFPGGFSYGDDIAAGKILANQIVHHLREAMAKFVAAGKPVIGICNGFQVLVKTELLPGGLGGKVGQSCTLTNNDCGRFVDRWVYLVPRGEKCIWTRGLEPFELPVAHGEGKFVPGDEKIRQALWDNAQVALVYAKENGEAASGAEPYNPNGSVDDIAGVCDSSGLVFGLMPHPERFVDSTQHYAWTRRGRLDEPGSGLAVFKNAVAFARGT